MPNRLIGLLGAALGLVAVALALTPALPARASVLQALELRDLVRESHEIVVGSTRAAHSRYDGERIVTESLVTVHQRMRGGAEGELRVVTLGGTVGNIGMRVEGAASLPVGGRAVLFLRRGDHALRPVGMAQGVLPIQADARGNDMAMPGGMGLALMQRVGGGRLVPAPAALMAPRPLDELCAEIDALVAADEGR
ncbi:MAG: hypothetical protein R3B40_06690 [Polyangiales bacterium]|nr:hypothetical protein [Myxococcales bacterium]MCB9657617.1 hypothetical protein [Sandaracinaceae bacterium]